MHADVQRSVEKILRSPRRQNDYITGCGAARIFINRKATIKLWGTHERVGRSVAAGGGGYAPGPSAIKVFEVSAITHIAGALYDRARCIGIAGYLPLWKIVGKGTVEAYGRSPYDDKDFSEIS